MRRLAQAFAGRLQGPARSIGRWEDCRRHRTEPLTDATLLNPYGSSRHPRAMGQNEAARRRLSRWRRWELFSGVHAELECKCRTSQGSLPKSLFYRSPRMRQDNSVKFLRSEVVQDLAIGARYRCNESPCTSRSATSDELKNGEQGKCQGGIDAAGCRPAAPPERGYPGTERKNDPCW